MNGRQSKKIRRKAKELVVEWLKSLLGQEEADKINLKNYHEYLPEQTHVFGNQKIMLSAFSEKWFRQKIKKSFKPIEHLTLKDFQ
jgi:hypothetical protein|tara:strand:+ start:70 stop:324 length:255 start_codon:yes stop_codon:yes gene_type:complete